MKLAESKALSPYFIFYGNIHYISEVLEHSCSYSIRCDRLVRQMPAPELILKWQRLTCSWNRQWVLEFWVAESEKLTSIQEPLLKVYGKVTVEYCSRVGEKDKDPETGAAALYDKLQSLQVHWSDASQHLPVDELIHNNCHITKKLIMLWPIYWWRQCHDNNWWAWLWQGLCSFGATHAVRHTHKKIRTAISTDLLRHTTMEARASCCRLSLGTKAGSTILNLTPSGNCWNDTIWHPQGQRNSTVCYQLEK